MTEFLTVAGIAIALQLAYLKGRVDVARAIAPPDLVPLPPEPPDLTAMFRLDRPRSRSVMVEEAGSLITQFGSDAEVGVIVMALEPDAYHFCADVSPDDLLRAADVLLLTVAKDEPHLEGRITACRMALKSARRSP